MALIRALSGSGGGGTPTITSVSAYNNPLNITTDNALYICGSADGNQMVSWGYVENGTWHNIKPNATYSTISYTSGTLSITQKNSGYPQVTVMYV